MTKIISSSRREKLDHKGAALISRLIHKILRDQNSVVFAIPGGRSVSGILRGLIELNIPWDKVHIFMVDERVVQVSDKRSNFRLAKESFIDELIRCKKLQKEHVHPFIMKPGTKDCGVSEYENELNKYGGKYDIVLLSAGEDGHVGALFPDHHSVKDDSDFFITMNDSPKPPKERMTMSRKLLQKTRAAILLFFGEGKKEALKRFLDKDVDVFSSPAKLVQSITKSYVLTDQVRKNG